MTFHTDEHDYGFSFIVNLYTFLVINKVKNQTYFFLWQPF